MKLKERLKHTLNLRHGPWGFLLLALSLSLLFLVIHALGLRTYTTVICGGLPAEGISFDRALLGGIFYVLAYAGFIFIVPILLIAAGIRVLLHSRESTKASQMGSNTANPGEEPVAKNGSHV